MTVVRVCVYREVCLTFVIIHLQSFDVCGIRYISPAHNKRYSRPSELVGVIENNNKIVCSLSVLQVFGANKFLGCMGYKSNKCLPLTWPNI